jgi:hypothetical protein
MPPPLRPSWMALAVLALCALPASAQSLPPGLFAPPGHRLVAWAEGKLPPDESDLAVVAWLPEAGGGPWLSLMEAQGGSWRERSRQSQALAPKLVALGLGLDAGSLSLRQALPEGHERLLRFVGLSLALGQVVGQGPQGAWVWEAKGFRFTAHPAGGSAQRMQELWVPPGGAWGPGLALDAPAEGSPAGGRWAGKRDASAVLRARRVQAELELEATVMDDRMTGGDALVQILPGGQRQVLGTRKAIPGGWQATARLPLGQLTQPRVGGRAPHGDLLRQATLGVSDSDGPAPPTLLLNAPATGAYLGRVRLRASAEQPDWEHCRWEATDFEAGDPRP